MSGRRGSNPRPVAWKATALPAELLPLIVFKFFIILYWCGGKRIRTSEDISQQIYSLPQLAALVFPQNYFNITKNLSRQFRGTLFLRKCKITGFFILFKFLRKNMFKTSKREFANCRIKFLSPKTFVKGYFLNL
jgi:hypothetical protein